MAPALTLALTGARHGARAVLGPLDLVVGAQETVAICGASGVGKTTLLRILAGLHADWSGRLDRPGRLAMVFQEPVLLPWRSALDNILLATGCSPAQALAALAAVDLEARAGSVPGALSLGQRRRLALARAFAAGPDVLLMDEPFVSLDPALADEMMGLFEALAARRPLATVLVTHVEAEAERLAGRVLRLEGQPARFA